MNNYTILSEKFALYYKDNDLTNYAKNIDTNTNVAQIALSTNKMMELEKQIYQNNKDSEDIKNENHHLKSRVQK